MFQSFKIRWITAAVLFFSCDQHQKESIPKYFTGQVEYAYTYQSDYLNIDSLSSIKPRTSIFRYDSLDYQSQFIGKDSFTYYYSSLLNKAASKTNNTMEEGGEDYSQPTDSILSFKIYESPEKILGYSCKVLEFETPVFQNKYYFSTDLSISPATYINHHAYNWRFYGEQTNGGLILKLEHRFKKYTMSGIATSITPMDNNFRALEIPDSLMNRICSNK